MDKIQKISVIFVCILMVSTVFMNGSMPVNAGAEPTEEWAARYSSPGNSNDVVWGICLDESSGNVYVTGGSKATGINEDYTTIAYDSDGNELWIATYNGPGDSTDRSIDITMDSSGNIYVTGFSLGNGTNYDYATIAYDSSGNELWVARFNAPANSIDRAFGITLDSYGNVYVTGESEGIGTSYNYVTVAYDPFGSELWTASYNGPANSKDYARDIALDESSGNIYVTGESQGNVTALDYATVAYDFSGNELWVARYNGPGDSYDWAFDMEIDESSGNVYVIGDSMDSSYNYDYATVAYDSSGNELWVARYDGPINDDDQVSGITLDLDGNIYVTGHSDGNGTDEDIATVAYDSSGNELWVTRYNGLGNYIDRGYDIAVDMNENVYVIGASARLGTGTSTDCITLAYDSSGNELWNITYNGPADDYDSGRFITVDYNKNLYVAGNSKGDGTGHDFITIKYSQIVIISNTTIDIDPNTLNLKSKGNWITCYIELPTDYDVNDIDISTVKISEINGIAMDIPAESHPTGIGDEDGDGISDLMVKFSRSEVQDACSPGEVTMTISGELSDLAVFLGQDTIRVKG